MTFYLTIKNSIRTSKKIPILTKIRMGSARYEKFLMYPSKGKVGWKNGQKFNLKATKKVALILEQHKETTLCWYHQYHKVLVFARKFEIV